MRKDRTLFCSSLFILLIFPFLISPNEQKEKEKKEENEGFKIVIDEKSGLYNISINNILWFLGGPTIIHSNNCWYSLSQQQQQQNQQHHHQQKYHQQKKHQQKQEQQQQQQQTKGELFVISSRSEYSYHPIIGWCHVIVLSLSGVCGEDSSLSALMKFNIFDGGVVFDLVLPQGLENPSTKNPFGTSTSFPTFSATSYQDQNKTESSPLFPWSLRSLTWQKLWSHGEIFPAMKGYFGGEKGGVPLVLWRDDEEYPSDVVVLSPFGNYMTSRLCPVFDYGREKERRENEGRGEEEEEEEEDFVTKVYENFQSLYCGLAGTISDVPSEYSLSFVLYYGNQGVTNTLKDWGNLLLKKGGKVAQYDHDLTSSHLGYWTDNGAYYYYNTIEGQNYAETMESVANYHQQIGLPVAYYQFDSWWYYMDHAKPNGTCTLFQCGGGVTEWEARPDVFPDGMAAVHDSIGKPLVVHNRYWSNDNVYTNYSFHFGKFEALPTDPNFFPFLLGEAKSWGVITYEQDWLVTQLSQMGYAQTNLYAAETWLMQMGEAAKDLNLTIQYCMPLPQFWLMSTQIDAVTQSRVTGDYLQGPNNFDIGGTSLLVWSLGLAPFKDVFWTEGRQPGNEWNITEQNPRMNTIISSLSAGPIGFGDGIGYTNISLVLSLCLPSGLLIRPDKPATPIERTFGTQPPLNGTIWNTYSTQMASQSPSFQDYRWAFFLSISIQEEFHMTLKDLGLDERLDYVVVEYDDVSIASPFQLSTSNQFTIPASPGPGVVNGKQYWHFYQASPIFPNSSWTFLGEIDKVLSVSLTRRTATGVFDHSDGFEIELEGEEGEVVMVQALSPQFWSGSQGVVEVKCLVSSAKTFTVKCLTSQGSCSCQ